MAYVSYEIFYEVARQNSFIRAAEVLNLTPSAVSHSIASLEAELGFPLFIRSKAGVSITKEGAKMLEHVCEILRSEELMHEEASQINGLTRGKVTIGTFSSIIVNWLPGMISGFGEKYPGIEIDVLQGDYDDVQHWVQSGDAEIGFSTPQTGGMFRETQIYRDRLLCVTPPGFRPENGRFLTIDEIRKQKMILRRKGYNRDLEDFLNKNFGPSYRSHYQCDDDQSIYAMIESGMGISILPELTLKRIAFDVSIWPFEPEEYRRIVMITQKHRALSPATSALVQHILDWLEVKSQA
ncbi:MAG: LysR family transcriptional regulator [Eubacteriaceae bacterium]|jgi:DNA-binding transcriptional LysR family regulator|nr:LysR family transcriptional regulator [Eubacteriaceae bacterium]